MEKLRCNAIIEVLGKPKEHVEKSIKVYVKRIKEDPELAILNENYAETKEKDNLFSTFVELDIVIRDLPKLVGFCLDYMPSSIEIVKPEEFMLKNIDMSTFINDLQAKLHMLDMIVKRLRFENEFLKKNLNTAIKNSLMIILKTGSYTEDALAKLAGVKGDEIKLILDQLVKDKKIKKEDTLYSLI